MYLKFHIRNTRLVLSRVSRSCGEGALLGLSANPFSDGVTIKILCGVDISLNMSFCILLHRLCPQSFPDELFKTEFESLC